MSECAKEPKEITQLKRQINGIKERIGRNKKRIEKWQNLLETEKIRETEIRKNLQENLKWVNQKIENQRLLAESLSKISEYKFNLQGIKMEIAQKNSQKLDINGNVVRAGQIVVQKVGELFLQESLAIELEKMEQRLGILEKTVRNGNLK